MSRRRRYADAPPSAAEYALARYLAIRRRGERDGDGSDAYVVEAAAREFGADLARAALDECCETARTAAAPRALDGGSFPRPRRRVVGDPIAPTERAELAPPPEVIAATAARIAEEIAALGRARTLPDVVAAIRKLGLEPPPDFSAFPS